MNSWGVAKCRERKAEIVEHLLGELQAKSTELPFGLDLADLLGEMVDEAIRLAEASLTPTSNGDQGANPTSTNASSGGKHEPYGKPDSISRTL
jgi:hypothetical protein